jgi:septum formation protein
MPRTMTRLILASSSPFRRALLESAGFTPTCISPEVDEDSLKSQGLAPKELAEQLAVTKAQAVWDGIGPQNPAKPEKHIVVGSDQVACLGDQIFSKPGADAKAIEALKTLNGKTHRLITSVCVLCPGEKAVFTNITELTMRPLDDYQIENYVRHDQPLNCAGSYMLEKGGIKLFERIQSEDFTAIQGLPMMALTTALLKVAPDLCF